MVSSEIKIALVKILSRLQHRPDWCVPFLRPFYGIYYAVFNKLLAKTPEKVIITPYKQKFYIDYKNTMERKIAEGMFEKDIIECFCRTIRTGDVIVDIGANIGFFSILASSKTGSTGRVYAFEPVPENYNRMVRNIALNNANNIELFPSGLSDTKGTVSLVVPLGNPQEASIFPRSPSELRKNARCEKYLVPVSMTTFDHFYREHNLDRIDIVKLDVEGSELRVLNGMKETLMKNNCKIFMELNIPILRYAKISPGAFFTFFRETGFSRCYIFETGKTISLDDIPADAVSDIFINNDAYNLLFFKSPGLA